MEQRLKQLKLNAYKKMDAGKLAEVIVELEEALELERQKSKSLEMLPKDDSAQIYCCEKWDIVYFDYETRKSHESISPLLRDALFDMIKWLKTNKII